MKHFVDDNDDDDDDDEPLMIICLPSDQVVKLRGGQYLTVTLLESYW